ncbi:ABC transporter permease [Bacteroidota bacterium]
MIKNYFKIAFRHIIRQKSFSIINILGLTIGIAVSVLILLYVRNELTYDKFHDNVDNKFRLAVRAEVQGNTIEIPGSPAPLAPSLLSDYPEVEEAVRVYGSQTPFISYEDKLYYESGLYYVDPGFLEYYTVEIKEGNPETALEAPYSILISEEIAAKYFGDKDPVGELLKFNNNEEFTVTGIIKKSRENSHLKYRMLASFETLYKRPSQGGPPLQGWMGLSYTTYVALKENADQELFTKKISELCLEKMGPMAIQIGIVMNFFLQPIESIYLGTELTMGDDNHGDKNMIYIFSAIAIFIILIACINYMNLSTAQSAKRSREVGIRKVAGASGSKISWQFLGESVLFSFISFWFALLVIELLLPVFNNLINKNLDINYIKEWDLSLGILGIVILVGLISGSYPSFFLSSFKPIKVLQGKSRIGTGNKYFRKGLVIFQFTISIILLCATGLIFKQLNQVKNKSLGFNKEQLVAIHLRGSDFNSKADIFKEEIASIGNVISVSNASTYPGGSSRMIMLFEFDENPDANPMVNVIHTDISYLETLGITLLDGRNLSEDYSTDSANFIVNEQLVKEVGLGPDPIGKSITQQGIEGVFPPINGKIIGIVKDYHFTSLHQPIEPVAICLGDEGSRYTIAKIQTENIPQTIQQIKTIWEEYTSRPFEPEFIDEAFDNQYDSEKKLGNTFIYFTLIGIFIACLGLFGLASFSAEQRIKEIGIRKVLGSKTGQIVQLLSKEYLSLILISTILGWIGAYFIIDKWLVLFPFKINIFEYIWIFILSSIVSLIIALVTISARSFKTANSNPANSLRYE